MQNSGIEWTDHTFNPWIGCAKVSAECKYCYAETMAERFKHAEWGVNGTRRKTSKQNWAKPKQWNREAENTGKRFKVFCASMADVFEARADLDSMRTELFNLISECRNLDWLLLTKRPEKIRGMVPSGWLSEWPEHVWIGTSAGTQDTAVERLPELLQIPAKIRFVSAEPLLGPVDLTPWLGEISWVIGGGESGISARPMDAAWIRSLRDETKRANQAFFFKQWGQWQNGTIKLRSKKNAGAELDGREWKEFPN